MTVTYSDIYHLKGSLKPGRFIVDKPFIATWKRPDKKLFKVRVPEGFKTDLASIPRLFQSIVPKLGKHVQPAIVHDYTYVYDTGLSKADADLLFLDGMKSTGVRWLRRRVMYFAVRIGGFGHWK